MALQIRTSLEEIDTSGDYVPHRPARPEKVEGGKRFELVSEYEPAGDQPTAIRELVSTALDGERDQVLLGVTGSGKTFTMAKVIDELQRPALILAPNKILAAQLYGEFKSFFPNPFVQTTTFGGNPLACAAAIATFNVLIEENLLDRCVEMGEYMLKGLRAAAAAHSDKVQEVRGKGLLIGIEFHNDEIGYEVSKGLFDNGVLVAGTLINAKTIRIEPPLTITYEEADKVIETFQKVLPQVQI